MPGAGSAIAANYIYGVAKPDGLTLGIINGGLYLDQILARREIKFDWPGFSWVGSSTPADLLLYMWANSPYKTIHDVRNAEVAPKCGATGAATGGNYVPKLIEETIGAKFNVVLGYQGGADIDLAVEKGEVQCRALGSAGFFSREPFHTWRKKGLVRVLVQTGNKRDARLPDVPTIHELMDQYNTANSSRRLARAMLGAGGFGTWPMIAPPSMPEERLKTLRAAFVKAVNNADLLAEAATRGIEVELIKAEDLKGLAKEVSTQPPEVISSMKKLLGK